MFYDTVAINKLIRDGAIHSINMIKDEGSGTNLLCPSSLEE